MDTNKVVNVVEVVKEVTDTNSVEVQASTETLEATAVNDKSSITKAQAVEEARKALEDKRLFLDNNKGEDSNIVRSATANVSKAEKAYASALQAVERPVTKVEFWEVRESTEEVEIIDKRKKDIIIATSLYNMNVTNVNVKQGTRLIEDTRLEDAPLFLVEAKLFDDAEEELRDLNGNIIPKGTPNVYVPVDTSYGYWRWKSCHEYNINATVKETSILTIKNVRLKKFSSLQEFAQYRGVNNVLSRSFNGLEKAGNAALATQQEFYKKVFKKTKELKANVSVITKYYNMGKLLSLQTWNEAMLGIAGSFEYDLSVGDLIIETLQDKKFKIGFIRQRYMIDAIIQLANYTPKASQDKIGIEGVINTIKSLDSEMVSFMEAITLDKVNGIYSELLTQNLKNNGVNKIEQVAKSTNSKAKLRGWLLYSEFSRSGLSPLYK